VTKRLPACFIIITVALVGCGKKGPPLAPVRIAPAAVTDLSARRLGDRAVLRFTLPEKNTDNSTPADVARVEVYALSVAKAADAPQGAEFMREAARIATVTPKPDEKTAWTEEALATVAETYYVPRSRAPGAPGAPGVPGVPGATGAKPAEPPVPMRMYMVVPVGRRNQRGPGTTAAVPLVDPPAAPAAPAVTYTEKAVSVTWPEVAEANAYNVYDAAPASAPPLNAAPLEEATFNDERVEFGKERCYRASAVRRVGGMPVESAPSPASCVTAADTFAPPAPAGLGAVAGPGTISLIWDAVSAADLAGYVVLRGIAPGDTLQALTPEPIKETTFKDAAAQPGVTYVYVVVAVDRSKNTSAQSARIEETAR
jgi:hypothetical protein